MRECGLLLYLSFPVLLLLLPLLFHHQSKMLATTFNIRCLPLSHIIVSSLVQDEKVAVAKAKDFLESNTYSAEDPYTTALSAYALALLRSPYAPLALRRLNHMAITQGTATHTVPSAQPVSHWRFMRSGIVNQRPRCFTGCQREHRCLTENCVASKSGSQSRYLTERVESSCSYCCCPFSGALPECDVAEGNI